jgi:hypothetical protein
VSDEGYKRYNSVAVTTKFDPMVWFSRLAALNYILFFARRIYRLAGSSCIHSEIIKN